MTEIETIAKGLTDLDRFVLLWGEASQPRRILAGLPSHKLVSEKTGRLTKRGQAVRDYLKGEK